MTSPTPPPRRGTRTLIIASVVVVVMVTAGAYVEKTNPGGIALRHPLGYHPRAAGRVQDNAAGTSLATVTRRSLSETTTADGTLGYAGSYAVLAQLRGTVTALPVPGQVISQGQVLFRVDGVPVVLLYGSVPGYRTLAQGAKGADVAELDADLVSLGCATPGELPTGSDDFSSYTAQAMVRLQARLGYPSAARDGALRLGHAVFLPAAARVATVRAVLGGPATGVLLSATSTRRQVDVNLDASRQSEIKAGDAVVISLPDNRTTPGKVSSVGTVATPPLGGTGGPSTVAVHVTPSRPADTGILDQGPVQVAISTDSVDNALVVPVTALLALAGGGNAVEAVSTDGLHHLLPVSSGIFDDAQGLVQVTGPGLAAGQRVVVPAS